MHHILRGALGAALVYPLAWYYYSQSVPVQPVASLVQRTPDQRRPEPQGVAPEGDPAPAQLAAPLLREGRAGEVPPVELSERREARTVRQRTALPAPAPALPREPELPRSPRLEEPKVPFPAFAELQEAFGQMKELQEVAHDPKALDERVQLTEHDPQKLARLKALAEQFVQLPPPASERYLPAGSTSGAKSSR